MSEVTVITPTITGRSAMLVLAVASVEAQTIPVKHWIGQDLGGFGPSYMRNLGVEESDTEWVAFLDDDDTMYPHHCESLLRRAKETGADVVYPWFDLHVMGNPTPDNLLSVIDAEGNLVNPLGQEVTPQLMQQLDHANWIPVTLLVRRAALLAVGGFPEVSSDRWPHPDCEDWGCWRDLRDAGFIFAHHPERTWRWEHHGGNLSGRADLARERGLL